MTNIVRLTPPKAVPWISWEEWDMVRGYIWSNDMNTKLFALEIVELWKLRGKVPHAVISTASLIEANMRDEEGLSHSPSNSCRSTTEMKHFYGSCILRAINGLVDPSQKGVYAESIYNIASRLGLPGWIVELRHEATHDNLPSLSLLRSGTRELLHWFHTNYWLPQQAYIMELSTLCVDSLQPSVSHVDDHSSNHKQRHDSSATFMTSILIPVIIQSTMISGDLSRYNDGNELISESSKRISTWLPLIQEFDELLPQVFVKQLTHHIIIKAIDLLHDCDDNDDDAEVMKMRFGLIVAITWLKSHLQPFLDSVMPSSTITASSYDQSSYYQPSSSAKSEDAIDTAVSSHKRSSEWIESSIGIHQRLSSIIASHATSMPAIFISDLKHLQELFINIYHTPSSSTVSHHEVHQHKKTRHIYRDDSFAVWPIGLIPGHNNADDLMSIQDINT